MPYESNEPLKVLPKEIGITAFALKSLLSQNNSLELFNKLCNNLNVDHLYVLEYAIKPYAQKLSVIDQPFIQLFETDRIIVIPTYESKTINSNAETLELRAYLNERYPDNWGMVVGTVEEYINFRPYLGKEDLYNLGGNNVYVR